MIFHLLYTNTEQNSCLHKLLGGLKYAQVFDVNTFFVNLRGRLVVWILAVSRTKAISQPDKYLNL